MNTDTVTRFILFNIPAAKGQINLCLIFHISLPWQEYCVRNIIHNENKNGNVRKQKADQFGLAGNLPKHCKSSRLYNNFRACIH